MAVPGNPLRQRLIAAGAQPERADAFVQRTMFDKGAPMTNVPGMKPKGPNEWYNESYASASESLNTKAFRPPSVDSPEIKTYFDIVYGKGAYDTFTTKTLSTKAPTFRAASLSSNEFDKGIVALVTGGKSLSEITDKVVKNPKAWAGRTMSDAISYATKLFNEYNDAQGALATAYQTQLDKNRDYKYRMPDPKLRYGTTTNLNAGTVDILTQADAAKAYAAYSQKVTDPAKLAAYKAALVKAADKKQWTPWKDEAQRRDKLKGTKYGG